MRARTPAVSAVAVVITISLVACNPSRQSTSTTSSNDTAPTTPAATEVALGHTDEPPGGIEPTFSGVTETTSAFVDVDRNSSPAAPTSTTLRGKELAILATDGVEEVELTEPRRYFDAAGAETVLIAPRAGTIQAMNHGDKGARLKVDMVLSDADPTRFGGLVLPGGVVNADALRMNPAAVAFVRSFVTRDKPIAAICHGSWTLIEAGDVRGRRMTSWPSLKTDLINAGAHWSDEAVIDDRGLVTSRKPDDIPAFANRAIVEFSKI